MNKTKPLVLFVYVLLSLVLTVSLFPFVAYADKSSGDASVVDQLIESSEEALNRFEASGNLDDLRDRSAYQGDGSSVSTLNTYPNAYDLRDLGVVTSVKNQSPWGTCWSFGAIAASEISIMSELGWTVDTHEIDLSELHVAWFSYTPLTADAGSQAGEGYHTLSTEPAGVLDQGGRMFTATSILSSGIGPVTESYVPYRNEEGFVRLDSSGNPLYYASDGDWSVDESLRFAQVLQLEGTSVLPSPATRDSSGNYLYDATGTQAIKEELTAGRGVDISFRADTSSPGQTDPPQFINLDTWAHYTYDASESINHAVTIVGWDDDYSASNFLAGHQPPADGAWIVKNSWGWKDGEFPHRSEDGWGVDGNGYFYLSYYDMSISLPESFDYFTEDYGQGIDYHLIDQYDFMPSEDMFTVEDSDLVSMANMFEATEDQNVRSLSCETAAPGTKVTYQLYLLNDDALSPEDGSLLTTLTETYAFGGFHRVQLGEEFPIKEGQRYSVVVTQQVGSLYQMIADRSFNEAGKNYLNDVNPGLDLSSYAVGIINEEESFLYVEGAWSDWIKTVAELKEVDSIAPYGPIRDYDNFPIKAFADPAEIPQMVTVPDLTNMTEAEALAALQQLELRGQAGKAEYSDTVEAGRVIRQDTPAGTNVDQGYLVTYYLSLGPEPDPTPSGTDDSEDPPADSGDPNAGTLAQTGEVTMPIIPILAALSLICVLGVAFSVWARRGDRNNTATKFLR